MSRKKDISLMRKTIVAGNWKMNKTPSEAKALIEELKPLVASETSDVVFCVPAIDIPAAIEAAAGSNIAIGAENMYFEESGAYTGEIAPNMLTDLGVKYVILGHSERREYFAETDETVNKKVKKALGCELKPIICVGETLEQREQGVTKDIITNQVAKALEGISEEQLEKIIIAYEPIWAIGTGKTATKENANDTIKEIRAKLAEIYGNDNAEKVIIQYGGSVKSSNAKELFNMSDIDGGLVGGASLKSEEFSKIVNFDK